MLYGCFKNILNGYAGDAIERCSTKIFAESEEIKGGDLILPISILEKFKIEIPNLDEILKLNHKVTKIIWNSNENQKMIIVTGETEFEADFCICTLPPGVMNAYHEKIFCPRLPSEKIEGDSKMQILTNLTKY